MEKNQLMANPYTQQITQCTKGTTITTKIINISSRITIKTIKKFMIIM